jgi:hypothetical protein
MSNPLLKSFASTCCEVRRHGKTCANDAGNGRSDFVHAKTGGSIQPKPLQIRRTCKTRIGRSCIQGQMRRRKHAGITSHRSVRRDLGGLPKERRGIVPKLACGSPMNSKQSLFFGIVKTACPPLGFSRKFGILSFVHDRICRSELKRY